MEGVLVSSENVHQTDEKKVHDLSRYFVDKTNIEHISVINMHSIFLPKSWQRPAILTQSAST